MSFGLSSVGQRTTGLRTDDGFVDLMSAQLDDFLGIPTERWYC